MKHTLLLSSILTAAIFVGASVHAQSPQSSQQPIEITATKTVEWLRNQKQYVARENVIVTQGPMTLTSDLLTADYREGAQSSMEIWQLTAEGTVTIADQENKAYGDKAVYDVPKGTAVLTGQNLKLVSPDQTVTARDRMEYYSNERMAKAIGNAKVVRTKDTLTADTITAYFKDDAVKAEPAPAQQQPKTGGSNALGGGSLDRLEAEGSVVIKTPTETLRGARAIYRSSTNTAELIGKVKIERGENTIEGERAEVNLTTNVSKMFGSEKQGGRVRGVFFPSSNKPAAGTNKGQDKPAAVPAPAVTAPAAPKAPAAPTVKAPASPAPQSTNSASPSPADPAKVTPR